MRQITTALIKQLAMLLSLLESTETLSVFLVFDATKYMVAAGAILKSPYPKLFHMICVAHLLHKCAKKVRSRFQDVDQLIAKVKSATVEN